MKVRVQFYAQLRDLTGTAEMDIELRSAGTARDLLEEVYRQKPALRVHDKSILVGGGVDFVNRDYVIQPGETIAIMPPVQGG